MESGVVFKVNDRNREELSREEIAEFANSLKAEKEFFPRAIQGILKYEVIVGRKVNGSLVGVFGINRMAGLPNAFCVVKSDFEARGIPQALWARLYKLIEDKYDLIICKIWKENKAAVLLARRFGFKVFAGNQQAFFMARPMSFKGKIMYHALHSVFSIGPISAFAIWLAKKFSSGWFV